MHDVRLRHGLLGPGFGHKGGGGVQQVRHAVAGDGGDAQAVPVTAIRVTGSSIRLGAHDQAGPIEQLGLVAPELAQEHLLLLGGRGVVGRRG